MKIILLNPHVDAAHGISQGLASRGVSVLFPADVKEALQILQLHGTSVDLAVIHREGLEGPEKGPGVDLIGQVKALAEQADLPMILSSEVWGDPDFTTHQATPQGVNAYLRWPYTESQLVEMLEAILGVSLPSSQNKAAATSKAAAKAPAAPKQAPPPPKAAAPKKASVPFEQPEGGTVLQDIGEIFKERSTASGLSIKFDAPDLGEAPPAPDVPGAPDAPDAEAVEVPSEPSSPAPSEEKSPGMNDFLKQFTQPEGGGASESLQPEVPAEAQVEAPPELASEGQGESGLAKMMKELGAEAPPPPASATSGGLEFSMAALLAPSAGSLESIEPEVSETPPQDLGLSRIMEVEHEDAPPEQATPGHASSEEDLEAVQEMPYIFGKKMGAGASTPQQSSIFAEAMGDAIIPGGVSQSPDVETIKKYLLLREQDVAVLSTQLKATQGQVQLMEQMLREEKAKSAELTHVANEQKQKIDDFEKEKLKLIGKFESEMQELNFQIKAKVDKARIFESQIQESAEEMEHLRERVRSDIRKIRVREKELENRLEIMKKDSEALMAARESKIIELKRKLDLLEFNMDLLQDQYTREKDKTATLRERLNKAAQIVRVAGGLLDAPKGPAEASASALSDDLGDADLDSSSSSGRQAS